MKGPRVHHIQCRLPRASLSSRWLRGRSINRVTQLVICSNFNLSGAFTYPDLFYVHYWDILRRAGHPVLRYWRPPSTDERYLVGMITGTSSCGWTESRPQAAMLTWHSNNLSISCFETYSNSGASRSHLKWMRQTIGPHRAPLALCHVPSDRSVSQHSYHLPLRKIKIAGLLNGTVKSPFQVPSVQRSFASVKIFALLVFELLIIPLITVPVIFYFRFAIPFHAFHSLARSWYRSSLFRDRTTWEWRHRINLVLDDTRYYPTTDIISRSITWSQADPLEHRKTPVPLPKVDQRSAVEFLSKLTSWCIPSRL